MISIDCSSRIKLCRNKKKTNKQKTKKTNHKEQQKLNLL